MSQKISFNAPVIIKLVIYSLIVGFLLKTFGTTAMDIYGEIIDFLAGIWDWLVGTGLEYILLGAAIVVPLYLFTEWRKKNRG